MAHIGQQALKPRVWNKDLALGTVFKKAIGLIFNLNGNALEGDGILFRVMATEEKFSGRQLDADIGLGAASIASI